MIEIRAAAFEDALEQAWQVACDDDLPARLRAGDSTLWGDHGPAAAPWLGWLRAPDEMRAHVPDVNALVDRCRDHGVRHALVLGMGGSSLCPEVTRCSYGFPSGIELRVLDSTDPADVDAVHEGVDPARAIYIVASKSGTTVEPTSFMRHFLALAGEALGEQAAAERFVAITDPGTALAQEARERGFGAVFENPADIGGRYSALSLFGLVPMALAGVPVAQVLDRAAVALRADDGARLGIALSTLAAAGRDKVTVLVDPALSSFGLWVEQLVAESLGKRGVGLVPVAQEPGGLPADYGDDRVFVYCRMTGELDRDIDALAAAGHPVITLPVADTVDLGALYMTWELATAAAGTRMDLNPFDQPNVQSAKDATVAALAKLENGEQLEDVRQPPAAVVDAIDQLRDGDYLALLAFCPNSPAADRAAADIRRLVRDRTRVATTFGYGPRFLHSTGQLHKGGPNSGVFVQMVSDDPVDLPIPGTPHTFSALKRAQAVGDAAALRNEGRRMVRIDLGDDAVAGLNAVRDAIASHPAPTRA